VLEAEIVATPPESQEEAAALARLIARMAEEDEEVPADQLAAATRAIAALLEAEAAHEAEHEAADIGSMLHRMRAFDRNIAYRTEDAKDGKPPRITVVAEGESMAPGLDRADRLARQDTRAQGALDRPPPRRHRQPPDLSAPPAPAGGGSLCAPSRAGAVARAGLPLHAPRSTARGAFDRAVASRAARPPPIRPRGRQGRAVLASGGHETASRPRGVGPHSADMIPPRGEDQPDLERAL